MYTLGPANSIIFPSVAFDLRASTMPLATSRTYACEVPLGKLHEGPRTRFAMAKGLCSTRKTILRSKFTSDSAPASPATA